MPRSFRVQGSGFLGLGFRVCLCVTSARAPTLNGVAAPTFFHAAVAIVDVSRA